MHVEADVSYTSQLEYELAELRAERDAARKEAQVAVSRNFALRAEREVDAALRRGLEREVEMSEAVAALTVQIDAALARAEKAEAVAYKCNHRSWDNLEAQLASAERVIRAVRPWVESYQNKRLGFYYSQQEALVAAFVAHLDRYPKGGTE